ncbi:Dihydrolipoyllysine-residue acetyltransferase component of pyruvate dehydrogenase complex [Alloiococcus otitis]|uniref:Dihydrolipoamide acetyltransferase component of pyruvate dehydrogenase complex n=1 Tax=Alloiococcus otitis ATCC 51267 TaxID=883081 RepID=K9EWW6_9LACT|nr:dihydrolipoamide acetyltransferase family protein [Alloiococcus otitis]EKU93725.1 pyruvate dehydrogenase complex dihydrolipoamide acetyltransferase [Alloiococcus otitis ATCC 51267]SUU81900.1 Dihydrolipoyllysine-residue acetyltransferase component of pyruvate dehydrogenase complex [Alloiococcus otitis]
MATEVRMPTLGLTMKEGLIDEWLVEEGDEVSEGDVVAVISSEKLTADVEAPEDGTIIKITADVGDEVPVKEAIAYVGEPGEEVEEEADEERDEEASQAGSADQAGVPDQAEASDKEADQEASQKPSRKEASESQSSPGSGGDRIFITPVARKLAQEEGYDIAQINGTGANGRITRRDVEAYQPAREGVSTPAAQAEYGQGLEGMRKTIASRMMTSLNTTAQVSLHTKADVTELMAMRQDVKDKIGRSLDKGEISLLSLVAKATILALKDHPEMNGLYFDGEYTQYDEIHLGIAVDAEEGLSVPVIKDAQTLSLSAIGERTRYLSEGVRKGNLPGDLYGGSTFSISNIGSEGIDFFTPIINTPEIGILGVGTVRNELQFNEDKDIVGHSQLGLSLTFDHQIVDGAPAARFLASIVSYLENPYELLL